ALDQCGLVVNINDLARAMVITFGPTDIVAKAHTGKGTVAHSKRHNSVSNRRLEGPLGMDKDVVAQIKVIAHLPVVIYPCKLDVTTTIVGVGVGFTVVAFDPNRSSVGHIPPFATFLNWLPPVPALMFDRRQHISCPAQIVYMVILFTK